MLADVKDAQREKAEKEQQEAADESSQQESPAASAQQHLSLQSPSQQADSSTNSSIKLETAAAPTLPSTSTTDLILKPEELNEGSSSNLIQDDSELSAALSAIVDSEDLSEPLPLAGEAVQDNSSMDTSVIASSPVTSIASANISNTQAAGGSPMLEAATAPSALASVSSESLPLAEKPPTTTSMPVMETLTSTVSVPSPSQSFAQPVQATPVANTVPSKPEKKSKSKKTKEKTSKSSKKKGKANMAEVAIPGQMVPMHPSHFQQQPHMGMGPRMMSPHHMQHPGMMSPVHGMPPQGMIPHQQGMMPQGMPPRGMQAPVMSSQGMPPQGLLPPQGMHPQTMPQQSMPVHQGMPPQNIPPQGMPVQGVPLHGMPQISHPTSHHQNIMYVQQSQDTPRMILQPPGMPPGQAPMPRPMLSPGSNTAGPTPFNPQVSVPGSHPMQSVAQPGVPSASAQQVSDINTSYINIVDSGKRRCNYMLIVL